MAKTQTDHLAKAKEYLAIAESGDSKREAYMRVAEEVAAHIEETGDSRKAVARTLQCAPSKLDALHRWRSAGYPKDTTPFTMADPSGSKPTDRAAKSHTKKTLREADEKAIGAILDDLPKAAVQRVARAVESRVAPPDRGFTSDPPRERPARSLFQRFAEHCFTGWKIQDEVQDTPPPTGDELARFRAVAEGNLAFAQAILRWLDTGDFDAEVAALLSEVQA